MTSGQRLLRQWSLRSRLMAMAAALLVLNLGAWLWALLAFADKPALIGIATLVYGLGLRHAVDADHIAAIDNVTRKLMRAGQRPIATGLFFAVGHSAIVAGMAIAIGTAATTLTRFRNLKSLGSVVSESISAAFLLGIAVMNIAIFLSLTREYRALRAGAQSNEDRTDRLLDGRGLIFRLLRPLFSFVTRSWHMALLGFLFGLGFDTATEITMFSISATQAARGLYWSVGLIFPALFAAGMALVDSADGALMLRAYECVIASPDRKLLYNMAITLISALIAAAIGAVETLNLVSGQLQLSGLVWTVADRVQEHFNAIGLLMGTALLLVWGCASLIQWGSTTGRHEH